VKDLLFSGQGERSRRRLARLAILGALVVLFASLVFEPRPPATDSSALSGSAAQTEPAARETRSRAEPVGDPGGVESAAASLRHNPSPQSADAAAAQDGASDLRHDAAAMQARERAENESPEAELSIAGSVLDDAGVPLPGVVVEARSERLGQAVTDDLGMFAFEGVAPGTYQLSVDESADHHAGHVTAMAGASAVDIRVQRKGAIRVLGQVSDEGGQPLDNARVRALGNRTAEFSDVDGSYEIEIDRQRAGALPVLEFAREGYREEQRRIRAGADGADRVVRLDVTMQPMRATVPVLGQVTGPRGEPVPGARILIASRDEGFQGQAVSDDYGDYRIDGVEIGEDYRISAQPRDRAYRRQDLGPVAVGPEATVQDIELPAGDEAEVWGVVVDPRGRAIPWFTVWLLTPDVPGFEPARLQTDAHGYFDPVRVPAGALRFETRAVPRLDAGGLALDGGDQQFVEVTMDWGADWLFGRVVDPDGSPVAQADIVAQWRGQFSALESASSRSTMSDMDGYFSFADLAAPDYRLTVSAPGFETARLRVPAGAGDEITVVLRESRAALADRGER